MRVRKFVAAGMAEAVAQVKRELGADAMIVSTRPVKRGLLGSGVEVTAAIDLDDVEADLPASPIAPPRPGPSLAPAQAGLTDADIERVMLPLRSELRTLKAMLRPLGERPASPAPSVDDELRGELATIRQALLGLRTEAATKAEPALADLAARHTLVAPASRRVTVLVGPTGVGKTTTIAKLAARAALIERRSVAIVTLDTYRIGGEEQMRAFADLMGVPLTLVPDPMRLAPTLAALASRDRVFVDTAGRSPRDEEAIATVERALLGQPDVEVHLTVAAGSPLALVEGWLRRFQHLGVDRLLFTKIDEAVDLTDLVRTPARLGCPVSYITTGQRVPEDLEDATTERLLELAQSGRLSAAVSHGTRPPSAQGSSEVAA